MTTPVGTCYMINIFLKGHYCHWSSSARSQQITQQLTHVYTHIRTHTQGIHLTFFTAYIRYKLLVSFTHPLVSSYIRDQATIHKPTSN